MSIALDISSTTNFCNCNFEFQKKKNGWNKEHRNKHPVVLTDEAGIIDKYFCIINFDKRFAH